MATYNDLVARIEVATVKLEEDVLVLNAFVDDIGDVVDSELAQLIADATAQANAAAASATQALGYANSADADAQAALDALTQAQAQATAAAASVAQAEAIKNQMLAAAPFQEAPINGSTYGRKDAAWVLVESGGGGSGTVVSVNGVGPDEQGNVSIAIPDATSDLTNDSGFITASALPKATSDLINNSGFITLGDLPAPAIATDAPADGKQYARKDNAWAEVTGGGGGGGSYTLPNPATVEPNWTFRYSVNPVLANGLIANFANDVSQTFLPTAENGWTQDGSIPLTTNPYVAVDVRAVNVYRVLDNATEQNFIIHTIIDDFNPATSNFEWQLTQPAGKWYWFNNSTEGLQFKKALLPGKWFVPSGYTANGGTSFTAGGLPSSMEGFPALIEVTQVANRRAIFITFMPGVGGGSTAKASKLTYFWDFQSNTWKNLGTGTV